MVKKYCHSKFASLLMPVMPEGNIINPNAMPDFKPVNILVPCLNRQCMGWDEKKERCALVPVDTEKAG